MLHPTKSQSILQWFNALTTNVDVTSLSQFADGTLFCDIVASVYAQTNIEDPVPTFALADCTACDESSANISAVDKSTLNAEKDGEASDGEQTEGVEETDDSSASKSVADDAEKERSVLIGTQKKYEDIKKFINDFFDIDSDILINYSGCIEGKDMELAKVAVLLLSAIVRSFLSHNNEALHTITLLEGSVQEDIKECLALFLQRTDKEGSLTKTEFHRVLGRATKYKATPRRKTPHRGNPEPAEGSKRRKERTSTIIYDEVQDSPLKVLLQSPNNSQHRTAIALFKKGTEITKLRNALHNEEMKVVDLILEKRNFSNDLMKKKEELEHLKLEFREYRETTEEREGHASMEKAEFLEEIERINKLVFEKTEELKSLQTENTTLINTNADLEEKLQKIDIPDDHADKRLNAMQKIQELENQNEEKDNLLQEFIEKIKTLEKDVIEYKQMYEENLNKRDTPKVTPTRVRETMCDIQHADAQEAVNKLNEREHEIQKLKNQIRNLNNQLTEKTDNMQAVMIKLSNLQENYDKLEQDVKNRSNVSHSNYSEVTPDSTATTFSGGKLWDGLPRENAPLTKSISTNGIPPSDSLNPLAVKKLSSFIQGFVNEILRLNFGSNMDFLVDANTLHLMQTIDDYIRSFEHILNILKGLEVPTSEPAESGRALRESALAEDTEKIFKIVKHRLTAVTHKLKTEVDEKKSLLKAANEEIKKLQLAPAEKEKEKAQLDSDWKKKYDNLYKCAEKFKSDKNKLYKMFVNLQAEIKAQESKAESCDTCVRLRNKLSVVKQDLNNSKQKIEELNYFIKDLEYNVKSREQELKDLYSEKAKLQNKIDHQRAYLLGNSTSRTTVVRNYFQQGMKEDRQKSRHRVQDLDFQEKSQPVVVNNYVLHPERKDSCNENSMSSHFANRSMKSVYLQTEDEEDFLNHSSLAQIQNGVPQDMEVLNPDERLRELQRRNTFCPPHLQSSYPLEIQNMTPSERKYSMVPSQFAKPESGYHRYQEEPRPSTSSNTTAVNKRKVSETDITQPLTSNKKAIRLSSVGRISAPLKPRTPIRKTYAMTFKTPSSIQRLMGFKHRKNKLQ